jgi:hypothetical protein
MAANTEPIFTLTPNIGLCSVAGANTASDGSTPGGQTAPATLFTAGDNGSRIDRIRYSNAQVTAAASSAMVIRFFITDNLGTNPKLYAEVALPTATRSVTAIGASGILTLANGLVIPSGTLILVIQSVYAGVQDLMHYVAEGGNY